MKIITYTFILIISFFNTTQTWAFNKEIGKGYCAIRHPVETFLSNRASCESQHVIQQQFGGSNNLNTIWINTTLHTYLDRSSCKPWELERPDFTAYGDENIERAYMIGVYANGYHYFIYDHHGDGTLTLTEWDGATHLLYLITTVINLPQKEIGYIEYQIERYKKEQSTQFIDAGIGVVADTIEVFIGAYYSALGIIVGTLFNPIDTLRNIPALVTLTFSGLFNAIWLMLKSLAALLSFGLVGSCGL